MLFLAATPQIALVFLGELWMLAGDGASGAPTLLVPAGEVLGVRGGDGGGGTGGGNASSLDSGQSESLELTPFTVGAFAYAIFSSVVFAASTTWAVKYTAPSTVTLFMCAHPLCTAFFSFIAFGRVLMWTDIGGGLALMGGFAINNYYSTDDEPSLATKGKGEAKRGGDSGGVGAGGRDGQWRKVAANGQEGEEDDDDEIDSESTRLLVDAAGTTSHRAVTCST